jgi:hypothetical protein
MMEQERELHDKLREMMDACRGEGRDLRAPEMRPLRDALRDDAELRDVFARVQALDGRVRELVSDVPVPAALERRLLAAAASSGDGQVFPEQMESSRGDDQPLPAPVTRREAAAADRSPPSTWRQLARNPWWLAAAATAAVLLLTAGWFIGRGGQTLSEEQLVSAVQGWTRQVQGNEVWRSMAEDPPLAERPLGDAVRALPRAWMRLKALDDPGAVVYEVVPPRGDVAGLLFVVKTRRDCGLSAAPYRNLSTGGLASGWNIAAWQTPELLYVLVVPGDGPSLQHYVPSTPAV